MGKILCPVCKKMVAKDHNPRHFVAGATKGGNPLSPVQPELSGNFWNSGV
jgi:hypothetical protein